MVENIVIIGYGAIGEALARQLFIKYNKANISVLSTKKNIECLEHYGSNIHFYPIDYKDESSISNAAIKISKDKPLDLVIVATGVLHKEYIAPEKSLSDIKSTNMTTILEANTVLPTIIAKYFAPRLNKSTKSVFAALSARVGSISDNRLGGWYSYRMSKAALNMMIKCCSIEIGRTNKNAIIVGLHPGTVASELSKPYSTNVPENKLFTPEHSAKMMLKVIDNLDNSASGMCYAWDGKEINP